MVKQYLVARVFCFALEEAEVGVTKKQLWILCTGDVEKSLDIWPLPAERILHLTMSHRKYDGMTVGITSSTRLIPSFPVIYSFPKSTNHPGRLLQNS